MEQEDQLGIKFIDPERKEPLELRHDRSKDGKKPVEFAVFTGNSQREKKGDSRMSLEHEHFGEWVVTFCWLISVLEFFASGPN